MKNVLDKNSNRGKVRGSLPRGIAVACLDLAVQPPCLLAAERPYLGTVKIESLPLQFAESLSTIVRRMR